MVMKKLKSRKGFTLAELLIVVAIIAVLVAVAVPVFSGALKNAQQAVLDADTRAAKAQAAVVYMQAGETDPVYYDFTVQKNGDITVTKNTSADAKEVAASQNSSTKVVTGTLKISGTDITTTTP